MENTFDINNFSKERQAEPASYPQCKALGFHFAKRKVHFTRESVRSH